MPQLEYKKLAILGAARSGLAAARLLHRHGYAIFVSEVKPENQCLEARNELKQSGIDFEFGGHTEKILNAECIVISPGIPLDLALVNKARKRGIAVLAELEIAARFFNGQIIAITGSNGKSTTATLLGDMFQKAGKKYVVAGNIGLPFSEAVLSSDAATTAILEVSSFQLQTIRQFKPSIAVLLNLSTDHLDRHKTFENYVRTKMRLFENQRTTDFAVYNQEDLLLSQEIQSLNLIAKSFTFHSGEEQSTGCSVQNERIVFCNNNKTRDLLPVDEVKLPGRHNLKNALAAALAALLADLPAEAICDSLRTFPGLEHRLEVVREIAGIKYVNDSKATNAESLKVALEAFRQPIILIAGGKEKGEDFRPLRNIISDRVRRVILLGETADRLRLALKNGKDARKVNSLAEALSEAKTCAKPGEVVLLSPGCSSFDMFTSFEERGRQFKSLVAAIEPKVNR